MRGDENQQPAMFSYVHLDRRVPADHPLRAIRDMADQALAELSSHFDALYARRGRPSIPPEQLIRALLLQVLYAIRSERQLMERIKYDLLFRWFVGLGIDEEEWDATVFTKNRDRLLDGEVSQRLLEAVLEQARSKQLLSEEHFTVDGTILEAWASRNSPGQPGTRRRWSGRELQHAWATAVETSQSFTGQALKAKIKTASSPEWLRFFALMGSAIAARERRPIVPGTPKDKKERSEELRAIAKQERIVEHLEGWNATMHRLEDRKLSGAHTFLLALDTANRMLRVTPFRADELGAAQQQYLEFEKQTEGNPQIQLVLVRVDSVDALRSAYPNYYVDSSAVIDAVRREIS